MAGKPYRGMVTEVHLAPMIGLEQSPSRTCVVLQNDVCNRIHSTTIVAVLTDAYPIRYLSPIYVRVPRGEGGLIKDSFVLCDQIRTIDQRRLGRVYGTLNPETMTAIVKALTISLDISFPGDGRGTLG